ncbi:MAG: homoserine dehydrogenase [Micavibrio sp.]|nr:MAG: homoserine dehydrogenase [Micavibrio sp.]
MTENTTLKIGIAGLGTVGASVVKIIQEEQEMLAARAGRAIKIAAVSARDKNRDRGIDLSGIAWADNAETMAENPDIDVVVELVGGSEGTAKNLVMQALQNGKDVVTANKALLAHHGAEFFALAEKNGRALAFEAAVAGGIPIIKALREGLAANHISAVYGILNGTCNYILTEMWRNGLDFETALKQAQEEGYAEADPSFDIDGVDAAHKLTILSALAFTGRPDFAHVETEGLRNVSAVDIDYAAELGYRIKLLGIARLTPEGVVQTVAPCMIPEESNLAAVEGATNAVFIEGDRVGPTLYVGAGAGGNATASAVIADLVDIARGNVPPSGAFVETEKTAPFDSREGRFYLRLTVEDRIGVMADVTAVLRDHKVSMKSILQYGQGGAKSVPLIMITHKAKEAAVRDALAALAALDAVQEKPCVLRVEIPGGTEEI